MLYLLFGNDTNRSHQELDRLVSKQKKGDSLSVFRVDEESFSESFFNELIKTENLFTDRNLIVGKRLFTDDRIAGFLMARIAALSSSQNIFIFWETGLKPRYFRRLEKHAAYLREFSLGPTKERHRTADFYIADLVALRKKQQAWLAYQRELNKGALADDIFWKIWWQMRSLLAVKKGEGDYLHPFVLKKSKRAASLFEQSELEACLRDLVNLYHQHRQALADLAVGVEKFLLRI
jgi:DNA polymerase III delta subunit